MNLQINFPFFLIKIYEVFRRVFILNQIEFLTLHTKYTVKKWENI
jgi:hypothetical protein